MAKLQYIYDTSKYFGNYFTNLHSGPPLHDERTVPLLHQTFASLFSVIKLHSRVGSAVYLVVEGSVFPDCVDSQSLQQVGPKSERGWFPNSCCCHICVIQLNIYDCKDNTFYLYSNTFFHLFVYTAEPTLLCNVIKVMADFFGHRVECYAFGTSDVTFPFVVGPRAEY